MARDAVAATIRACYAFIDGTEAERLMNVSISGLNGAVFGPDSHVAGDFATKLEAGGVSIHDTELPHVMMFRGEKTAFRKFGMDGSRYDAEGQLDRSNRRERGKGRPIERASAV